MARLTTLLLLWIVVCLGGAEIKTVSAAQLMTHGYAQWLEDLRAEAIAYGVNPTTIDRALDGVFPDETVVSLDQKQPEKKISFEQYLKNVLPESRVQRGQALYVQNAASLKLIAARYGVPPEVIIALWGIESSYGKNQGRFNVVQSLVTLAYEGRRADFFRGELLNALRVLDVVAPGEGVLQGSWAGAMGQCQFMPRTYLNYAVDGDGDGLRDIWRSERDVFASIANYLASEGWRAGMPWGYEVFAPDYVQGQMAGTEFLRPLAHWRQLGVTKKNNSPLPDDGLAYALVTPDGVGGRSFLVTDNFRALMRWNRSTYFGVSVGMLADRVKR